MPSSPPLPPLAEGTTYRATLTTGVADAAGNNLAANYSWTFTVRAPVPVLTGSPRFSKDNAQEGDAVQITVPVSPNTYSVLVCLAPKPVQTAALQVSLSALELNGCSDIIINSSHATEITVPFTVQADAIWGEYYPSVVLKDGGTATALQSFYEIGSSPTFYKVSTQTGTADDYLSNIVIPFPRRWGRRLTCRRPSTA